MTKKKLLAIVCSTVVTIFASAGTAGAETEGEGGNCSPGFHSFIISPNEVCFDQNESEGEAICRQICPNTPLTAWGACWIVPAGVAQACTYGQN